MNQRGQRTMDKKKSKTGKRRKSNAGKRHGRAEPEEKPKSAEVMNEKEKLERLEAANVLSSLMFLPPKSSEENENLNSGSKCDIVTPSSSVTQISMRPLTSGIPATSQSTSLVLSGRGSPGTAATTESEANLKNSLILAHLQNQLSIALKNKNMQPVIQPQTHSSITQNHSLTVRPASFNSKVTPNDKSDSQNVPVTVLKQNLTINKNVAKALRQAVSNNKIKAEFPGADNLQGKTDNVPDTVVATNNEHERMECDSLPSSRKAGGPDNNLPLKKRRLIGMNDESLTTSDLNLNSSTTSTNLDTLASARQIENILQMAKDYPASSADSALSLVTSLTQSKVQEGTGYRPVQFDPRTSLMVLSDLKFALTPDDDGDLPIHIAVVHENIDLVKKFIDIMAVSGKTVDRFNKLQQTPLHLAVLVNKPDIISVLLIAGANPNLPDRHGYTSLHLSVNKQHPECMEAVFKDSRFPVRLNTRDYEGYYPLHSCVELYNIGMMMSLVKKGAEIDSQDGKAGRSVLMYAVEYNRGHMVKYLLDNGATADLQNYASVTPMMIAQAGNQDDIVAFLNKALDIGNKYEESFIPTKKVPVQLARLPLKSFQISNKDRNVGRSISSEIPLIYEEYNAGSKPQIVAENLKIEPLSRQSSVSSPIDLSMRNNTKSPLQHSTEMSIRGKPGRRKTKKEHKNHKEKQPQKSMVKEKHASVVAALERSMFAEDFFPRKVNDKVVPIVEPYIKVEAQDSEDVEMNNKTENGDTAETENVKSNLPSASLGDFILNLKPDQTKYLVEKVRQQLNVHKDQISSMSPNGSGSYATESDVDNRTDDKVKCHDSDPESMDQDSEEGDAKNDTPVIDASKNNRDRYLAKIVSLRDKCVTEIEDVEMNEEAENEKETGKGMVKECRNSPVIVSRTENVERTPEAQTSNEQYCDNVSMDHSPVESMKINGKQTSESLAEKLVTHSDSKIDSDHKSVTVNNENETDKYAQLNHKENKHEHVKNYLKNCIVKRSETSLSSLSKSDSHESHEKLSYNVELVSQVSQESGSSSSLQGSQASHGFDVMSPPVSNGIQGTNSCSIFNKEHKEAEHSDDSMEIEFPSDKQDDATHESSVNDNKANLEKVKEGDNKIDADEESESMLIESKEIAKASIDTDEDDEETGLVIDECVDDETEINGDIIQASEDEDVNLETDCENNDTYEVNNRVARDSGFSETSVEANEVNKTENGQSFAVCNGEIDKGSEKNDSRKNLNGETISNTENSSGEAGRDISNGKTRSKAENPTPNQPDVTKPDAKLNAQGIKEQDNKIKQVGAGGLGQSIPQEDMLKKGQSHTLFYHDGDSYKPIKIFIDNSEQSSLVLQRMFQSAQLANMNRPAVSVAASDIKKTSSTQSNISVSRNLVTTNSDSENSSNKAVSSSPNRNVESVTVTSTKHSGIVTSQPLTEVPSKQSYQQVYVDSIIQKVTEDASIKNSPLSIKQSRKRTPFIPSISDTSNSSQIKTVSQSAKIRNSNSPKMFDSQTFIEAHTANKKVHGVMTRPLNAIAGKYTSEGTLTRVNPDIRSKLSKALLSQKKGGLVRSESDTNIVQNKGVLGNIVSSVATVQSTVTDARQQL